MLKLLMILVIAIIIAALLFTLLKKAVKLALFIALVIIIFIIITNIFFPETNMLQKGKNYILEKSETMLEKGKDKATSYVIVETNQTVNKATRKFKNKFS
jgi:undecaprenyl pyrophosphate phosphatase UppP